MDYIRRMSTADIVESLREGNRMGMDPLIVNEAGTIMQGNHRITVLIERGFDVNTLPRVPHP